MRRNPDLEHLQLLSVLHYVGGGILGFCSCIPIIHVAIGVTMLTAPQAFAGSAPPPQGVGWVFVIVGGGLIVFGWTITTCLLLAGRFLSRHTHRTFCLVAAALGCLWMPLGTILGIFTILVLLRPSVRALFDGHIALEQWDDL